MSVRLSPQDLEGALRRALAQRGYSDANAAAVATILTEAELDGIASHGLRRLPIYLQQVAAGGTDPAAEPSVEHPSPALARIDGRGAPGPRAALLAVRVARERAAGGSAAVAVRNAGHVGPLAPYVERLADAGRIGLAVVNTPAAMAPPGSGTPLLGTNPVAFAAPAGPEAGPLVIDLSLTVAARGRILAARQRGQAIPEGWAVDPEGADTNDPEAALAGALLPAGGAKGFALALMVETLAGALAGGALSPELELPWEAPGSTAAPGFFVWALDPAPLAPQGAFEVRMANLATRLGAAGGRLPGARRRALREQHRREGIEIPDELLATLAEAGLELR